MSTSVPITSETITKALVHRYPQAGTPSRRAAGEAEKPPVLSTTELIACLRELPRSQTETGASLLRQATSSAGVPGARDQALLASIDDCIKIIFALTRLDPAVEREIRAAIPEMACHLLRHPVLPVRDQASILTLLDSLVGATLGWTPALGRQGEKLSEFLASTVASLRSGVDDLTSLIAECDTFLDRELGRVHKLEERLAAAETGQLRTQQSRVIAAEMINQAMASKQLTQGAALFLKGVWYESVQLIILTLGVDSEAWLRARQVTETILWTYQPLDEANAADKQKLYRIVEHLPREVNELLLALEHNSRAAEQALEIIQADHVSLVSGQALEYEEFELIDGSGGETNRAKVSSVLLRKVKAFQTGQWFIYQGDEVVSRIKLVVKLDDVQQLLFTNRYGMKVLQLSFDEFAYLVSSGVARPVGGEQVFTSTFRAYYEGLIFEREKQIRRYEERRAAAERQEAAREAARAKALTEAAALARAKEDEEKHRIEGDKRARLEAASAVMAEADPARIAEVSRRVTELAVGAWLHLPDAAGSQVECKLAVRISASDKMIFVSRAGTKIGEYSSDQLVQLLVAGQGQIQDEGVEFEDTLAEVVSRLRNDRHKSYDDLTGE